jgi:NAD(P)-dependent dehydrogenase (short-subunit alcohol dehydrogenase family)
MNLNLSGKRVIVTGGSKGIGRAIVERFIDEGAIVATCARGQAGLSQLHNDLADNSANLYSDTVDVTDANAYTDWFEQAVQHLGGLDILVSNCSTRVSAVGEERWRETFDYDLLQHVRTVELAAPHLKESTDAAAVMIASIAYSMVAPPPDELAYAVMKAGLVSYASQMSVRLGPDNIRVNSISPGPVYVEGGAWDKIRQHNPDMYQRAQSLATLKRLGKPEEVASAVAFLASPVASYITGTNLRIDGGLLKSVNY